MMNEAKSYKVNIFDDEYTLVSDKKGEFVIESATLVNEIMKSIAEHVAIKDVKKIAVLTAIQLASKFMKAECEIKETQGHGKKLIDQIDQELFSSFQQ